jgi:hypothetical protein
LFAGRDLLEDIADETLRFLKRRFGHAEVVRVELKKSKILLVFKLPDATAVKVVVNIRKKDIRVYSGRTSLDLGLKRAIKRVIDRKGANRGDKPL